MILQMDDAWLLGRFLGPGLAASALIGIVSAWLRGLSPDRRRPYVADLAVTLVVLAGLAVAHVAAARGVMSVEGRLAFLIDAAFLHLVVYWVASILALAILWPTRRRADDQL